MEILIESRSARLIIARFKNMCELALIRIYCDLTGAPESAAKAVVSYLDILQRDYYPRATPSQEFGTALPDAAILDSQADAHVFDSNPLSTDSGQLLPAQ